MRERVLIVELYAHRAAGHWSYEYRQLARALHEDGVEVHVLTSQGILERDAADVRRWVSGVHQYDAAELRRFRQLRRWSVSGSDEEPPAVSNYWIRALARAAYQVLIVRAIVRTSAALDDPPVIVLAGTVRPLWATLTAPSGARWVVYLLSHMPALAPNRLQVLRQVSRVAAARERVRRRRGGHVQLAANNESLADAWMARALWQRPIVVPFAGVREAEPLDRDEARRRLGMGTLAGPLGLAFGHVHPGKDLDTVFLAFAGEEAPTPLVAAGRGMAHAAAVTGVQLPRVTVLDGEASDDLKRVLHSAADYLVLSYRPDRQNDSGGLSDAVAYGIPVLCSDAGTTAGVVTAHGLGLAYRNGDPDSLRDAATRIVDFTVDPDGRATYLDTRSTRSIARRLYTAARLGGREAPGSPPDVGGDGGGGRGGT